MSNKSNATIATIGIDIGKNSLHVVGLDQRGAIVLRQKWSRGQIEARLANIPPCLIGMEACVGAHHLSRTLQSLGHDARLMPAKYSPDCRGQLPQERSPDRQLRRNSPTNRKRASGIEARRAETLRYLSTTTLVPTWTRL
jgi:transposase